MKATSEDISPALVVEGDAALIMRIIRNHTSLSLSRLKAQVIHQLDDEDSFDQVVEYLEKNNWLKHDSGDVQLSGEGEAWLDNQGGALDVEEEDTGIVELKKPYDVAKLKMEPKHLSVFQALRKIEKKEIHLNPDFQRAFVWDEVKQSRLIESVLIRIPLPAFYLDATDEVRWSVVDGLQRLTTLHRYCREETFALTGLQFLTDLNEKRFSQLPPKYKVLIEDDTQLLFYNLMPGTPVEAKFTIFSRVNTGGMQLTPQEIRHALSQGKITILLARLVRGDAFRTATEGVVESLRMSDRELVLRAMAFMHFGVERYRQFNELDAFLLFAMSKLNELPDQQLKKLEDDFIDCLWKVRAVFGRYSFRKFYEVGGRRSPLNKALFEVWVACVRRYNQDALVTKRTEIKARFMQLISPSNSAGYSFTRAISASTGSYSAVQMRFTEIERLLEELIV